MSYGWKSAFAGFTLAVVLLIPLIAIADNPEAKNLYERGRFELEDENYAAALQFLEQALQLDPGNLTYQFSRGQALVKLKRYEDAAAQFLKIGRPETYAELAALYAEIRRYPKAIEFYDRAMEAYPERADLYLARGGVYLELKDYEQAEADFREASRRNPKLTAAALYHEALISYRQEDLDTTDTIIDQALAANPDPALAGYLKEFKTAVAREQRLRKWWAISLTVLAQYDDNVSLEPLDSAGLGVPGAGVRDKKDFILGGLAGLNLYAINSRKYQLGASYLFRSLNYTELTENDLIGHNVTVFTGLSLKPVFVRFQAELGMYDVDREARLHTYGLSTQVTGLLGTYDRLMFTAMGEYRNMLDDTEDARRYELGLSLFHTFPIRGTRGVTARGGVLWEHQDPVGDQGALYREWELIGGVTFPLPGKLEADIGGGYAWVNYDQHVNIDPNKARRDQRISVSAKIGRSFLERFRMDLIYTHTYNHSNLENNQGIDLYEFHRNVYTLFITGTF